MKFLKFTLPLLFLSAVSVAQTTPTISDDDLRKYAVTMDSVDGMKATLTAIISEMVQTNKVMSVARYNELFKITKDEAQLAQKQATPEEIAFLKDVEAKREEEVARINLNYQALAKDYVGLKAFNAIRKSLETDEALKAKYESISKEIESKGESKGGE
jgi:hypothetical protein